MTRLVLAIMALLWPALACAHESRPAYLELIEARAGTWHIVWKQPVMGEEAVKLEPRLSNGWLDGKPEAEQLTASHYLRRWHVRAPAAQLEGARLTIGGLDRTIVQVLVHLRRADGKGGDTVLRADRAAMTMNFGDRQEMAARAYLGLGLEHILGGADHLLFVAALVLLVGLGWRLAGVITAFTLGHSLTLAASTLGWVKAPVATIEALVALSLVFVARELLVGGGLTSRKPWIIAALFGLLHGFAFAGALAETGLPEGDIPLALLLFNLGVEAGQLAFVAALLALMLVWRSLKSSPARGGEPAQLVEGHRPHILSSLRRAMPRVPLHHASATGAPARPAPPDGLPPEGHLARLRPPPRAGEDWWLRRLAPYAIGCYAGMLFVERTAAVFA